MNLSHIKLGQATKEIYVIQARCWGLFLCLFFSLAVTGCDLFKKKSSEQQHTESSAQTETSIDPTPMDEDIAEDDDSNDNKDEDDGDTESETDATIKDAQES